MIIGVEREVTEPDGELVQRAACGDAAAFTEIFHRYQPVVNRFARIMTGCSDAAEDVSQEVFVAVFRDLGRYDPTRATFTTYLYGIARNLSRERTRKESRFSPLDVLRPDSTHVVYIDDPAAALEGFQLTSYVRRALQRLPLRDREIIVLCDLHGFSYADAGLMIGISTAAVRSRLYRARHLLRQRLAPVLNNS